jgi:hypothetical protein
MTAWRIKDWGARRGKHRLFECAQSKKYDRPAWLPLPINLTGDGFRTLMSSREGQAAFGVFVSLCELSAHLPVRGCILSAQGAFTLRALCAKTGVPVADLEAAIALLEAPEIGWLQRLSDRQAKNILRDLKRETSGSNLPDSYTPEPEPEPERETKPEPAVPSTAPKPSPLPPGLAKANAHVHRSRAANPGHANGIGSALAAVGRPEHAQIVAALRRYWPKPAEQRTAEELASHPNATIDRVLWLVERVESGRIRTTKAGFIRKGIETPYDVPAEWSAAKAARLAGAAT